VKPMLETGEAAVERRRAKDRCACTNLQTRRYEILAFEEIVHPPSVIDIDRPFSCSLGKRLIKEVDVYDWSPSVG